MDLLYTDGATSLPMFAELMYLAEHQCLDRLQKMKTFVVDDRGFGHIEGFNNITGWLGFGNPNEMLDRIHLIEPDRLRQVFREKLNDNQQI